MSASIGTDHCSTNPGTNAPRPAAFVTTHSSMVLTAGQNDTTRARDSLSKLCYLFVAWMFTFPPIVDQRLDFWQAMRLSRKLITKHWWKFFGFLIVLALINMAGLAAVGVGLFITFPITFAALTYAYNDIIGAVRSPSAASSSA